MANNKLISVILIILCVISLSGCCGGGGSGQTPSNQPPFANAGSSQTIHLLPGETTTTVSLNGSATDADGTIVSYLWSGTPAPAPLNAATATVTLSAGTYTFTLVATDNLGAQSAASTVTVTVDPAPTKALITFSTSLPAGLTEQIGSVDVTIELPAGVTLATPAGVVPTGSAGLLKLSGEGASFAGLPGANTSIIGNYTPATATAKATVTMSTIAQTNAGQGMNAGEYATLSCDLTPGATVRLSDFTPFTALLIGNASGVKLYDPLVGISGPASASFNVTFQ
jgi:hypothetical protein